MTTLHLQSCNQPETVKKQTNKTNKKTASCPSGDSPQILYSQNLHTADCLYLYNDHCIAFSVNSVAWLKGIRSVCPLPDDHVAVGTHGRASPSRDMFCHLDQGVLIFRMGLRYRSGWDRTPWDTGTSITLHTEGWSDQTSPWTVACGRWKRDKRIYWLRKREKEMVKEKRNTQKTKKVSTYGITNDACASVFSAQVCELFDLYPLCLYTQQVLWRCMQLADYCCHNHGFTTSIFTESFTAPSTHSYGIRTCIHMTKHTHIPG